MKAIFVRVFTLVALALLLWVMDRAVSSVGLTSAPLSLGHAAGLACAMVLLLCTLTGRWP